MLPLIPMAVRETIKNIPWRLIAVVAAVVACAWSGIWFRGVLADRAALTVQNGAQAAELAKERGEVKRLNLQKAQDAALFEQVEQQRAIHAAEIAKQTADIRRLRERLDNETKSCFDRVLPPDYLDRLP